MNLYEKEFKKAKKKVKDSPSGKLMEEMKGFNPEFKRIARSELRSRGAIPQAIPRKKKKYNWF